ncbi:MAG: amidohydrolase family protein [Candidatus Velamenicoccus archaeovorus]
MRAIDCHVHVRTGDRAAGGQQWRDAQRLFGAAEQVEDLATYYRSRDMLAVVFDVDARTSTGERADNDEIAALAEASEGALIPFATIDPWTGKAALDELERCRARGFRGLKLQPITQRFHVDDVRFRPLWDYCQSVGWPVLVHTGTTGIGADSPGGGGLELRFGRPIPHLDDVAAEFPRLQIVAAHFGWPWHLELLAVARHKSNVHIDLSGWSPKYIPPEVVKYCNSVIPDRFLFGTDFPLLTPDRWLEEFDRLGLKDEVREMVLVENARRILGIEGAAGGGRRTDEGKG